jgi:hypothetical protein
MVKARPASGARVPAPKAELVPKVTTVSWTAPGGAASTAHAAARATAHGLFSRRVQLAMAQREAARREALVQAGAFNSTGGRPPKGNAGYAHLLKWW